MAMGEECKARRTRARAMRPYIFGSARLGRQKRGIFEDYPKFSFVARAQDLLKKGWSVTSYSPLPKHSKGEGESRRFSAGKELISPQLTPLTPTHRQEFSTPSAPAVNRY